MMHANSSVMGFVHRLMRLRTADSAWLANYRGRVEASASIQGS